MSHRPGRPFTRPRFESSVMRRPDALLTQSSRQLRTAVAGAIAVVLLLVVVLLATLPAKPMLTAWLALALATLAFAMACLALLRARMLAFCPEVLGGDVILPRPSRAQDS